MKNQTQMFVLGVIALTFSACTEMETWNAPAAKDVQVLGRTWTVSQNQKNPNSYSAIRDLNNFNPYGKPVALLTPQAVRAIELASNCRVVPSTLKQDTTARFYADVVCNR